MAEKNQIKERITIIAKKPKMAFYTLAAVLLIMAVAVGCTFTGAKIGESEIVPLTEEEIVQYNKTFEPLISDEQGNISINPLCLFLTSLYDRPEDISLVEFLRYFPSKEHVTEEAEFEALKTAENWPFGPDIAMDRMPVPIHKFTAETVNEALKKYMGITLDDLSGVGTEELIYLKEYDAYYNYTSDFAAATFSCTRGERQGDIIRLYDGETIMLTLKKQGDGFLFVSYQRAPDGAGTTNGTVAASTGVRAEVSGEIPETVIGYANYTREDELDKAVKSALLQKNQGSYFRGECAGEGHIILGHDEASGITTVYALTMYGEYGFENGNFMKVSGSGVIPAVFTFTDSENGLVCTKIEYPQNGEGYGESIRKLFPSKYLDRALSHPSDSDSQDLRSQERSYAANYLKELGRDAVIGDYGNFEHTLLTDVGVSVEVSNSIPDKLFASYPMWIGNREALENGIRYVYEMSYNEEEHEIVFTKYEYDTHKIVEFMRLDSITGLQSAD